MSQPSRLELRLLGRFAAHVERRSDPIRLSSRKGRALLAYIAMRPDFSETRERLAALLWGDTEDSQARQSLRQCLASLRKEIEPFCPDVMLVGRDTVALVPARVTVDAREFLRLAEASDANQTGQAAEIYSGPFLNGFVLDDEAFADWLRAERARIETVAARVLESHARGADQQRRGAVALRSAERLVALDPTNERAQRLLLEMLLRHSGRDAAIAQAEKLTVLLRRELGVGPDEQTRALITEISRAKPRENNDASKRNGRTANFVAERVSPAAPEARPPAPAWRARIGPGHVALACVIAAIAAIGAATWVLTSRVPISSQTVTAAGTDQQTDADKRWASPAIPGVTADQPWLAAQGLRAVLVLPFSASSAENKAEQALADRLSDDLIGDLSRVPAMRVISRQTSIRYRGHPVDPGILGGELGVHYIVEGHLRLDDTQATINVALIDTASRLQVWSDRLSSPVGEQFNLSQDVTRALARRLQINLAGAEDSRQLPRSNTSDAAVRDLLSKGWGGVVRLTAANQTGGPEMYFEEVLKRDPENLSAKTGLAAAYVQAATMFLLTDPKPRLDQAEVLLKRVIAADPSATLPHFYLGMLEKNRANPHEALAAFNNVLTLNPSYAPAYAQVGHVLSRIGRLNEAIEHVRYAVRLSPKDHALGIWLLFGGQIELELGHDDVALDWLRRAVELTPRSPFAQASLAAAYAVTGDRLNSAKHTEEVRRVAPTLTLEQMKERVVGLSDKGGQPRRLLEGLHLAFAKPN